MSSASHAAAAAALVPAFECAPHFGTLCPKSGLGVLHPHDAQLASRVGLRIFVYRSVPPSFHSKLFTSSLPAEMRQGQMCDFASAPCTPADPPASSPGYSKGLNEWLHSMKHCADVPLLAKLLALGALPGVYTDDPRQAHLFVVPSAGVEATFNTQHTQALAMVHAHRPPGRARTLRGPPHRPEGAPAAPPTPTMPRGGARRPGIDRGPPPLPDPQPRRSGRRPPPPSGSRKARCSHPAHP